MAELPDHSSDSQPPETFDGAPHAADWLIRTRWSGLALIGGLLIPLTQWLLTLSSGLGSFTWLLFPAITLAMLVYPFFTRRGSRPGLPGVPPLRWLLRELATAIPVAAACLGLNLVIMQWATWMWPDTPYAPERLQRAAQSELTPPFLLIAAWSVIITPAAEEFFYRGFLQNAIRQHAPLAVAVTGQAVVFGASHGYSLGATISTTLLGALLGLVYHWRGTLVAPCLVHALYNAAGFAVIIGGMLQSGQPATLGIRPAADGERCVIESVIERSPAAAAGIRAADIILEIDGQPVANASELFIVLRQYQPQDQVEIGLERDGLRLTRQVILMSRSELRKINDAPD